MNIPMIPPVAIPPSAPTRMTASERPPAAKHQRLQHVVGHAGHEQKRGVADRRARPAPLRDQIHAIAGQGYDHRRNLDDPKH